MKKYKKLFYILSLILVIAVILWVYEIIQQPTFSARNILLFRSAEAIIAIVMSSLVTFLYSEKSRDRYIKWVIILLIILAPLTGLLINSLLVPDQQLSEARLIAVEQKVNNLDYRTRGLYTDDQGRVILGGGSLVLSPHVNKETQEILNRIYQSINKSKCNFALEELNKQESKFPQAWEIYTDISLCYFRLNDTKRAEGVISIMKTKYPSAPSINYFNAISLGNEGRFDDALDEISLGITKSGANTNLIKLFGILEQEIYFVKGIQEAYNCSFFSYNNLSGLISWQVKNISFCYNAQDSFNKSAILNSDENLTLTSNLWLNLTKEIIIQYLK